MFNKQPHRADFLLEYVSFQGFPYLKYFMAMLFKLWIKTINGPQNSTWRFSITMFLLMKWNRTENTILDHLFHLRGYVLCLQGSYVFLTSSHAPASSTLENVGFCVIFDTVLGWWLWHVWLFTSYPYPKKPTNILKWASPLHWLSLLQLISALPYTWWVFRKPVSGLLGFYLFSYF